MGKLGELGELGELAPRVSGEPVLEELSELGETELGSQGYRVGKIG